MCLALTNDFRQRHISSIVTNETDVAIPAGNDHPDIPAFESQWMTDDEHRSIRFQDEGTEFESRIRRIHDSTPTRTFITYTRTSVPRTIARTFARCSIK